MKEKEVKEERGRRGVFNLLSTGEQGRKGEKVQARQTSKRGNFRKGGEG